MENWSNELEHRGNRERMDVASNFFKQKIIIGPGLADAKY